MAFPFGWVYRQAQSLLEVFNTVGCFAHATLLKDRGIQT